LISYIIPAVVVYQEKKLQFTEKYDKILDKGKQWKDKGKEWLDQWHERSNDYIGNFLEMFGGNRIVSDIVLFLCY